MWTWPRRPRRRGEDELPLRWTNRTLPSGHPGQEAAALPVEVEEAEDAEDAALDPLEESDAAVDGAEEVDGAPASVLVVVDRESFR